MLAQFSIDTPTFPRLPGPPLLQHLFLESPTLSAIGLIIAAIVVWVSLADRLGRPRARLVVITLVAIAAGMFILARAVTTTRERLIQATRTLIGAIANPDAATVKAMTQPGAWAWAYNRWEGDVLHELIAEAERSGGRYNVMGASFSVIDYNIRNIRAHQQTDIIAKTQVNITATTDEGPPTATWFELDWDKTPEGWKLRSVVLLWDTIGGNHKRQ